MKCKKIIIKTLAKLYESVYCIPFCNFSLVVKCMTSNLRVLGSNSDRGTHVFPSFFQFPLIFNYPRELWAPVFIFFTVINCKIPLFSFNNTFNSWFTFVESHTYPNHDLTPDWTPHHPDPDFYNIFNSWFTPTHPTPHPITPSTFQFYNSLNSLITSTRRPIFFNFTINSILGSHPPDPSPARPPTDPHPTTPDFFNFQIASILGSHPAEMIFIRGICLEEPIVFNTMI